MAQRLQIGNISVITDDSTGMYVIGEVDGGFNTAQLREHIVNYGDTDILRHLAYMVSNVVGVSRDIDAENQSTQCSAASNIIL